MNTAEIIDGLHAYERKTLSALKDTSNFDEIVSKTGLKEVQVMRAVQWLQNKGLVTIKEELKELVIPDSNGKLYLRQRLPERRFLEAIKEGPLTVSALKSKIKLSDQEVEVCIGILRKKLAIEISKKPKGLEFSITGNGKEILESGSLEEQFLNRLPLEFLSMGREDRFCYDEMKKRSRIVKNEMVKTRTVLLTKLGSEIAGYDLTKNNLETLTPEIIKSSS